MEEARGERVATAMMRMVAVKAGNAELDTGCQLHQLL